MPTTANFEEVLTQIMPKNKTYLLDFVARVNTYSGVPIDAPKLMAGRQDAGDCVILLPGSFLDVGYMRDVAQGLSADDHFSVWGINYPGRIFGDTDDNRVNRFLLVDYVGAVYQALLNLQKSQPAHRFFLVGHSLGTIVMQMLLFVSYYNQTHDRKEEALLIDKIAVLGGGPPRLGFVDYILTFTTRLHTLGIVMQMVNQPGKFITPSGTLWRTLGSEMRYQDFLHKKMIYQESAPLMAEAFLRGDYAFLPSKLLEELQVHSLFAYSPQDLFVHEASSRKAARQWGAQPLAIPGGHSEMLFDETGIGLGRQIAQFFQKGRDKGKFNGNN